MQDFDKIYSEYFSGVYKFALALCQNQELAEEIAQETFFKALKSIDKFDGKCKISTWLCQIAKNTYFDHIKKQKLNKIDYSFETIWSNEDIEEQFSDKETAYAAHKALHKLKEPYKEVFGLRTFGELPFSKIAALFEKTESWARVTYYRAKMLIKEELK